MPARITRRKPLDKINYLMMVRWKFPTTTKGETQRRGQFSSLLRRRRSRRSCGPQQNLLHQRSMWWMMQRSRKTSLEPTPLWYELDDRWIQEKAAPDTKVKKTNYLLHWHCKTEAYLNIDLKDGQIFRVDSDTDTLTEGQLINNW